MNQGNRTDSDSRFASGPASPRSSRGARLGVPCGLALFLFSATLALFWPAVSHPFMAIDDGEYVTQHPFVPLGFSWVGLGLAFTARHSGNWHPLTTISHMLDCQVFGLDPAGHHFVNLLLHSLNAALVFWVLRTLTGSVGRSFFVAAFFAFHPLRVESVAWVAERKDVLSVFFALLTLQAYARYSLAAHRFNGSTVRRFNAWYLAALGFFGLGLMSKPMLVTLPFVLLLLDYWPLRRIRIADFALRRSSMRTLWPLLREKIPFFILCFIVSYITSQVQQGAMAELKTLPLSTRVANMFLSYGQYLAQSVCPINLAVVYPYDPSPPLGEIAIAVALVLTMAVLAWLWRKRLPWFAMGWFWFLGTLIPVIGIVQVGIQAHADRYTYLPSIGLWVLVVWSVAHLVRRRVPATPAQSATTTDRSDDARFERFNGSTAQRALALLTLTVLCVFAVLTRAQLAHWESTEKLLRHTERVAGPSALMRGALAGHYLDEGRLEEAAEQYRLGLRIAGDAWAHVLGLANVYAAQGKAAEAERLYRRTLAAQPSAGGHFQLANFLQGQNRLDEARSHYLQSLALAPYQAVVRNQLGNVHAKQGNWPAAREQFERALRLNPRSAGLHFNLANVLAFQGKPGEAAVHYRRALELGRRAVNEGPASARAHFGLAGVYAALRQPDRVAHHLREAIRLDPKDAEPLNNLAWLLATHPEAGLRDGAEAVRLSARAVELTRTNDAVMLDTLAAAHAETGDFDAARAWALRAVDLATHANQTNLLADLTNRLERYRQRQPWRQP